MGVRSFRKLYSKLMGSVFTTVRPLPKSIRYRPVMGQEDNIWYKQRTPGRVKLGRALVVARTNVDGFDWITEEFAEYDADTSAEDLRDALRKVAPHGRLMIITYLWIVRTVSPSLLFEMSLEESAGSIPATSGKEVRSCQEEARRSPP